VQPISTYGCFPWRKSSHGVKLTTHLHLVSRLRIAYHDSPINIHGVPLIKDRDNFTSTYWIKCICAYTFLVPSLLAVVSSCYLPYVVVFIILLKILKTWQWKHRQASQPFLKCATGGSHNSDYENYCLLGCDAVQSGRSLPTFHRNVLSPFLGYLLHHTSFITSTWLTLHTIHNGAKQVAAGSI
jgi:hypothetical protein